MKRKIILKTIIILTGFLLISILCNTVTGDSLVDSDTIKDWANSYLDEYMKIVEGNFGHEYGYYFDFYGQHPVEIKSILAENGVAITMIPNLNITENMFEVKYTENSIETAVFDYNELNFSRAIDIDSELYFKLIWGGEADRYMFIFNNSRGNLFSYGIITTNQGHFVRLIGESELTLSNMIVDNISYDFLYLNGCIKKSCWTNESAKEIATSHIWDISLMNSFLNAFNSNEFKEIFAYPDLESKILDIKYKLKEKRENSTSNYTMFDWELDLKELDYIAFDKYGIANEFLQKIIEFLDADYIFPSEHPPSTTQKQDEWKGWQFGVGLFVLQLIIIITYIRYKKELKQLKLPIPLGITIILIYGWIYTSYFDKIIAIFNDITLIKSFLVIFPFIPIITYPLYHKKLKKR